MQPSSLLLIVCVAGLTLPSAHAADAYSSASAAYAKGDYASAKAQFLKALKAKPANWKAEYQLANSCMQLRSYAEARKWYASCLSHHPDASTASYCQSAVGQIDQIGRPRPAVTAQPALVKTDSAPSAAKSSDQEHAKGDPQLEARKREIMGRAQKRVEEIRKAADARIQEAVANSNQRYTDPNTGIVSMDISADEKQQIMKEADQQAQQVMEQAKRDCNSVR